MTAADPVLVLGHRGLLGRAVLRACGGEACAVVQGGRETFDLARAGAAFLEAALLSGDRDKELLDREEARRSHRRVLEKIARDGVSPETVHANLDLVKGLIEEQKPGVVINCAAYTDVDRAETDRENAMAVNAYGAEAVASACARSGCHLVHISTDYVFDGKLSRPYKETDEPGPVNFYGLTKLEGEKRVAARMPGALIVRSAWLFGPGRPGFVGWVLARGRAGEAMPVVEDQVGSPTYSLDLAEQILQMASRRVGGMLHIVNSGQASRLQLARQTLALAGMDPELIRPTASADLGFAAKRPGCSVLDNKRHARLAGGAMPGWLDALGRFVARAGKEDS